MGVDTSKDWDDQEEEVEDEAATLIKLGCDQAPLETLW
jgi:hypothetical protein